MDALELAQQGTAVTELNELQKAELEAAKVLDINPAQAVAESTGELEPPGLLPATEPTELVPATPTQAPTQAPLATESPIDLGSAQPLSPQAPPLFEPLPNYGQPALYGGEPYKPIELPEFDSVTTGRVKLSTEVYKGRISSSTPTQASQTKVPQPLRDNWWNYLFNPLPVNTREGYVPLGANFYIKNNGLLGSAWDFLTTPLRAGYGLIADTQRGYYWLRQQTANSPLARLYEENERWMKFIPGLPGLNEIFGDREGASLAYQKFNQSNAFPERKEGFSGRFVSIFPNLTAGVAGAQMAAFDTEQQTRDGSDVAFEVDPREAEFTNPNAGLIFGWHNPFTGEKWFDYNRYAERGEEGYEWIQNLPRFLGGGGGRPRIGEEGLERPWLEVPYSLASVFAGTAGLVISDAANPTNLALDIPLDRVFGYIGKSKFWKANVQPWLEADVTLRGLRRNSSTAEPPPVQQAASSVDSRREEQLQRIEDLYRQLDEVGAGGLAEAEIAATARTMSGTPRTYTPEQATDVVRMQLLASGRTVEEADFLASELNRALTKPRDGTVDPARATQVERLQAIVSDIADAARAELVAESIYERELRRLITGKEPDMSEALDIPLVTVGDAQRLTENDLVVFDGDTGRTRLVPDRDLPLSVVEKVGSKPGLYWDGDVQSFRADPLAVPVAKLNELENVQLLYDADTQTLTTPLATAYTEDDLLKIVDSLMARLTPEELEANRVAAIALLPEETLDTLITDGLDDLADITLRDELGLEKLNKLVDTALATPEWAANLKLIAQDVVTELEIQQRRDARRDDIKARLAQRTQQDAPAQKAIEPETLIAIAQSRFPEPAPIVPPANIIDNLVSGTPAVTTSNAVGEAIPRPVVSDVEKRAFELKQRGYTSPEIIKQTGLSLRQLRIMLSKWSDPTYKAALTPEVEPTAIERLPSQVEPTAIERLPSKAVEPTQPVQRVELTYKPTALPEPVVNGVEYSGLEGSVRYWKLENVQSLIETANYAGIKLNVVNTGDRLVVANTHDELVSLVALHENGYLPPSAYKKPGQVIGVAHPWYEAYRERVAITAAPDPYAPGVGNVRRQQAEAFATPKLKPKPDTQTTAPVAIPEPTPVITSQALPDTTALEAVPTPEPVKAPEPTEFEVVEVESAPEVEGFIPKTQIQPTGITAFDTAPTYEAPELSPELDEVETIESLADLATEHELQPPELPRPAERRRAATTDEMHEAALADIASGKLSEYPKTPEALARWYKERESAEAILRAESNLDKLQEVTTKLDNEVYVSEYEQNIRSDARRVGAAEAGLSLEEVKANVRTEAEYILNELGTYTDIELRSLLSREQLGVPGYGKLKNKAQRYALAKATLENILDNLELPAAPLPADNPTAYKVQRLNEALYTGQGVTEAARQVTDQLTYENTEELLDAVADFRAARNDAYAEASQRLEAAKAKVKEADEVIKKLTSKFYEPKDPATPEEWELYKAYKALEKAKTEALVSRVEASRRASQTAADEFVAKVMAKRAEAEAATKPTDVLKALDELEVAESAAKAVIDDTVTVPVSRSIADELKAIEDLEVLKINKDIIAGVVYDFPEDLVDLDKLRDAVLYDLDDAEFVQAVKALAEEGRVELVAASDPTEFTPTDLANAVTVCGIPIKSVRFL